MSVPPGPSLVIGGTGMLRTATIWLAVRSSRTLVVARHASRVVSCHPAMLALDTNWNCVSLRDDVLVGIEELGRVGTALLWLHEPDPALAWLLPLLVDARVVLVLGSMDGMPADRPDGAHSCTVRLGSKATPSGRRWLTHDEIADAAISSLRDGRSRIVGDLQPVEFE